MHLLEKENEKENEKERKRKKKITPLVMKL